MNLESFQFTEEGMRLATFKMCIENNALLHSLKDAISKIYAEIPSLDLPPEVSERCEIDFNEVMSKASLVYEAKALKKAFDYATEHDSNLDFDVEP